MKNSDQPPELPQNEKAPRAATLGASNVHQLYGKGDDMNYRAIEANRQPTAGQSLIPVKQGAIGGVPTMVCDARELHKFLGVGKRFTTWMQDRVKQYGFIEGEDFLPSLGESAGGRPSTEYQLSLDMAKELAMVENNDQGRRARRYFIEMERRALALAQKARPSMTAQYPQQGTTTLSYEGFKFRIIWLQGSPWFAAIDVCRALVLRDSNTILRYLPAEQKQKIRSGKSDIHIISLAGFNIATLRADERRADKLRRWVDNALTTAMSPENALDNLIPESYDRTHEPAARTYSEDAMLQMIGRKRFCATMEPDGGLRLREIPDGVFMLKPTEMPSWISDPAGCPQEILPQLLVAISQRMGTRALH